MNGRRERRPPRLTVVEPVGRGGLIHYAYQMCRALTAEGLQVELVTSMDYELADLLPHDFRVVRLLSLWNAKPTASADEDAPTQPPGSRLRRVGRGLRHYREWARLIRYLRRRAPDIVQLGDLRFAGDALAVLALRRACPRLVDVCHNIEPFRREGGFGLGRVENALYGLAYRQFDRVFVHYRVNRQRFLARFRLPEHRVRAIAHGDQELLRELDAGMPAAFLRRELDLHEDDRVVLFAGTLSHYKGIDLLLRAAAHVARSRAPRTRWVIAGYPLPDFDLVAHRVLAAELGIADDVRFVPRYLENQEVGSWMRLADVVALPYREGFQSGVLHLARTFGVPVVASRTGSFPEAIEDGVDGLLHEPEDVGSLADALTRVLADEVLRRRLALAAKTTSDTRHSWGAVARIMAGEYRALLASSGASEAASRRWEQVPR